MKADRPILFSGPMVRALLDGRKTQTRRVIDFAGIDKVVDFVRVGFDRDTGIPFFEMKDGAGEFLTRPKGKYFVDHHYSPRFAVGDRLWVREAWRVSQKWDSTAPRDLPPRTMTVMFPEGGSIANQSSGRWEPDLTYPSVTPAWAGRLRQGMHMPRWASRLTLTVTDVRIQRLQQITEEDAVAEGAWSNGKGYVCFETKAGRTEMLASARQAYAELWDSLNAERGFGWDANPWVTVTTFSVVWGNIDEVGDGS